MTLSEIEKITTQALVEEFEIDPEKLVPQARIKEDLELDSLDIVDMVVVLEKAFHFKLTQREKLATIRTLNDIYTYIAEIQADVVNKKA
ncbi:MAG: acyl carrier protein [Desulfovibrio sp.]|nr:acyl carrier protein [Desulfovibrio sp.]